MFLAVPPRLSFVPASYVLPREVPSTIAAPRALCARLLSPPSSPRVGDGSQVATDHVRVKTIHLKTMSKGDLTFSVPFRVSRPSRSAPVPCP